MSPLCPLSGVKRTSARRPENASISVYRGARLPARNKVSIPRDAGLGRSCATGPSGRGHAWTSDASLLRSREDLHFHHLDPAVGELGELGEPVLDVRHRVMGLEISLVGEDFIKYEMARGLAIFLEEIDEILRITPNERDER